MMDSILMALFLFASQASQIAPGATADCSKVKPLLAGQEAVCDGLLVPEERYTRFVNAELSVADLSGRLEIKDLQIERLETLYQEETKPKKIPWYRRLAFNRVASFCLGAGLTALAVYGGTKVVQASAGR